MTVKIADIQRLTANYFEVSLAAMTGKNRETHYAHPRMIAMTLSREMTERSLLEIAAMFKRDHSTVIHAIGRVNGSRFLRDNADRVRQIIESTPPPDRTMTWLVREQVAVNA